MSDERVIWKFEIWSSTDSKRRKTVRMPKGARILSVQPQGKTLALWAIVDMSQPAEERTFISEMTGIDFGVDDLSDTEFLGTVQFSNGAFVLHVFEDKRKPATR